MADKKAAQDRFMIERQKAFAYITRGLRLLVFEHRDAPEAGIQVPAGSIEPDETPEAGALREASEETGLTALRLDGFLGDCWWDRSPYGVDEKHHRYFYHLICEQETAERWTHGESTPSEGEQAYIPFVLYWVNLPDGVPELAGEHGIMLPKLFEKMGLIH
jgi:8-oxo-dGTP pyrophosphatase MutT (NUDIX family)